MDPEVEALTETIAERFAQTPPEQRLLIAVAGAPGSGKSTLAYPLTSHLNAILRHRPERNYDVDNSTGLMATPPAWGTGEEQADDIAICVGLDGWHYSRSDLDEFADPVEAHWRRGAAFTFNLPSYLVFLQHLRLPLIPDPPPLGIPFPTFDHALKDPAPSPYPVLPQHRIVIIEGLYTMLDRPGWQECADVMDMRVWVETDKQVCRSRLIRRNYEAGIVDDLKACEERVDASDMVNGEEVRRHKYMPTHTIMPVEHVIPATDA